MTVATSNRSQSFAGGQSVLTFNFRTLVSNPEYVLVSAISSGTTVVLAYNSGYTVSVNPSGVGGTVTVSPTYGTNYTYVVYRSTAAIQQSAFSDYNTFPSSTIENGYDRLTMIAQEELDNTTRSISLPIGSSPSISTILPLPVASEFLAWDPTGLFLTNTPGVAGPPGPVGPSGSSGLLVSSSTTDVTVVTTSTTATITSINADTGGSNTILRLNSTGGITIPSVASSCISGTFSSTKISALLGTRTSGLNTQQIYQAATDGQVTVSNIGNNGFAVANMDPTSPPTSCCLYVIGPSGGCCSFFVPKNWYWTVSFGTITFISSGS